VAAAHMCTFTGHDMGSVIGTVITFYQNINLPLILLIASSFCAFPLVVLIPLIQSLAPFAMK